jgi:hypothetical protein
VWLQYRAHAHLCTSAQSGERATGSVPRNRGKNTTLIASLSLAGMGAAMILEGSANATAFAIYVEQLLIPSLQAGQIVVMDNLRAHKGERVRQAIETKGCQVLFSTSLFARLLPHRRDLLQAEARTCDERKPERVKRLRKPSARLCSLSQLKMHVGGSATVALF